mgnify:CR=1 FL=1
MLAKRPRLNAFGRVVLKGESFVAVLVNKPEGTGKNHGGLSQADALVAYSIVQIFRQKNTSHKAGINLNRVSVMPLRVDHQMLSLVEPYL